MQNSVWQLRRGLDRRFRTGHPWAYSNELTTSPKGVEPGALVELRDNTGGFLARGFGNPNSLISFRALTRDSENVNPLEPAKIEALLERALDLRIRMGFEGSSYRLFFGEADGVPGWIIDRYLFGESQAFVVQAHTAGAERLSPILLEVLQRFVEKRFLNWDRTAVILRNDMNIRKLEGLAVDKNPVILKSINLDLTRAKIQVKEVLGSGNLTMETDLIQGQKTGYFLDQFANIQLAAFRLAQNVKQSEIKILDLCSYVGQWGAQLTRALKGVRVEVTAVDASSSALEMASRNIQAQGGICKPVKADVLHGLEQFSNESFDWVISDPPALIKSKKDIPQGTHAYLQLATQVFRLVKSSGAVVCCSCSGLLDEDAFAQVLGKAARRNSAQAQWVGRGSQSPDHPVLAEFPEGKYLKSWIGIVQKRAL